MRQRRRRARLLEVPEPDLEIDPERRARAGRARRRPRPAARAGRRRSRAHVRPRSLDAHPLHARRHDRQQLLRRPLGDGAVLRARARGPPTTSTSSRSSPTAATGYGSGPAATAFPRSSRDRLRALADRYGDLVRDALSEDPAPRLGLQPRRAAAGERLQRRPRARRHRGHAASPSSRRPCTCSTARRAGRSSSPATTTPRPRPTTCSSVLEHRPLGLEGVDDKLIEDMTMLGLHRHDLSLLPDGRGWLVIEVGGETQEEADEQGRAIIAHARAVRRRAARHEALRRPGRARSTSGTCARPASARRRSCPGKPDTHEGWEDSAVPPERLGEYLRKLRHAGRRGTATRARSTATTARAACTRAGTSTWRPSTASPRGGASWTRPPTSCSRSAARSRASTATASRGPSCCRRCSATSSSRRSASSSRSGIRTGEMNPGKIVDPVPDHLEPAARPRLPAARGRDPLRLPARRRQLRARDDALRRHRQLPPRRRRRDVPELHGHARGEALDARPRASALGDAERRASSSSGARPRCARRSTSASRARAARTTARSTSTCRRSRRSSSPHHYAHRLRPRSAYAFGLIDRWARLAERAPGLANALTQTPGLAALAKTAAGVSQHRRLPAFASRTLPATGSPLPSGAPKARG